VHQHVRKCFYDKAQSFAFKPILNELQARTSKLNLHTRTSWGEKTKARHISGQDSTFLYKTAILTRGTRAPARAPAWGAHFWPGFSFSLIKPLF